MENKKIPIVILTKDNPKLLRLTISSILRRTRYAFHIFIVDNKSKNLQQHELLEALDKHEKVTVIYNDKNQWILGFNKAFAYYENHEEFNQKYAVLSDDDIIVPPYKSKKCWLTYLVDKMDENIFLGKIGLCLDTSYIKLKLPEIYKIEKKYMQGPFIGDLIIAPVDTTMAIYRKDIFLTNSFKMVPGHASIIKPYYYICRTDKKFSAIHTGWINYQKGQTPKVDEKIICFTKYAAYVNAYELQNASLKARIFYHTLRFPYKFFWFLKVIFYWARFFCTNFPRNYNQIQSKYR
jgi:glycosyltransferase involved in cell wall biosynthesis